MIPSDTSTSLPQQRPGQVTAVVVITYIGTGFTILAAVLFLILGLVAAGSGVQGAQASAWALIVLAPVAAAFGIFSAYMAHRLGQGSRGWRTAYLWITGITVLIDFVGGVILGHQFSALLGIALDILCIVFLTTRSSREWFDSQP